MIKVLVLILAVTWIPINAYSQPYYPTLQPLPCTAQNAPTASNYPSDQPPLKAIVHPGPADQIVCLSEPKITPLFQSGTLLPPMYFACRRLLNTNAPLSEECYPEHVAQWICDNRAPVGFNVVQGFSKRIARAEVASFYYLKAYHHPTFRQPGEVFPKAYSSSNSSASPVEYMDRVWCLRRAQAQKGETRNRNPGVIAAPAPQQDSAPRRTEKIETSWTEWLSRDTGGGSGDYEDTASHNSSGNVCANPIAIECRTIDDHVDWRDAGQDYTCTPEVGGVCQNKGQSCKDFEVRFQCSQGQSN